MLASDFDLLDEVEQKLGLSVTPLSFPIGMGYDFKGIYNIFEKNINLFSGNSKKNIEETIAFDDIDSPELEKIIGTNAAENLRDNLELVHGVYPDFDKEAYLKGELQPVFFGSALNSVFPKGRPQLDFSSILISKIDDLF